MINFEIGIFVSKASGPSQIAQAYEKQIKLMHQISKEMDEIIGHQAAGF
jgi:hypothetical protein